MADKLKLLTKLRDLVVENKSLRAQLDEREAITPFEKSMEFEPKHMKSLSTASKNEHVRSKS